MKVLIDQNSMLFNENTILHHQVHGSALHLHPQQVAFNRWLEKPLTNLSESNVILTMKLKKENDDLKKAQSSKELLYKKK